MKNVKCEEIRVKKKKIFFTLLMLFITLHVLHFTLHSSLFTLSAAGNGTSGAQFLKIGVGARAVAMGEAYAGMEGDINSIYWNPAGLSGIDNPQTSFSHTAWFQNIKRENLTSGYPTASGFMALGINYLTAGGIDKYDNAGDSTGESYAPADMLMTFAYSKKMKKVSIGSNLKYISSNIDGEIATAIGADFGGIYRKNKLNIGLAVQNLGTKMKFVKDEFSLPLNIKLGGAYKFGRSFIAALDFNFPNDNDSRVNTGVEYSKKYGENLVVALRTGYKTNTEGLDASDGLSAGFGLRYGECLMDYAWVPYGDLGVSHRISFTYRPKEKIEKRSEEKQEKEVREIIKPKKTAPEIEKEIIKVEKILSTQEKKALMGKHFNKATQFYKQGNYFDAISEWEEVLKINPDHALSLEKIERTKEKLRE
ncbi:MAG: PorV/PorQ family protein [bacterium]